MKAKKLLPVKDKYDLLNLTMCEKQGEFHDLKCIYRECLQCGVQGLTDLIMEDEVQPLMKYF